MYLVNQDLLMKWNNLYSFNIIVNCIKIVNETTWPRL